MNVTPVRPSQFVTRNGPGSLIPTTAGSILIPSLQRLVKQLQDGPSRETFKQPDSEGNTGLDKFTIADDPNARIIRLVTFFIKRFDKNFNSEIKIFRLPTNADLRIPETRNILTGDVFPRWGICSQHVGDKILMEFSEEGYNHILRCPMCISQKKILKRGVPIRYVQACTNGHLQDLYWPSLVHGKAKTCDSRIFRWREFSTGDNFVIHCTKCKMNIPYVAKDGLKTRSTSGRLYCGAQFPEFNPYYDPNTTNECPKAPIKGKGGSSAARIVMKNSSGLHIPKLISTVSIPTFTGPLHDALYLIKERLDAFCIVKPNWKKKELVDFLKSQSRSGIPTDTIDEVEDCEELQLRKNINNILNEMQKEVERKKMAPISESESNDEELTSLLQAAADGFPPATDEVKGSAFVNIEDVISIDSKEFGLIFRITPIRNIKITKVQVGYSREIGKLLEKVDDDSPATRSRIGKLITENSYYNDKNRRWYLGDEMFGEALFIDIVDSLDTKKATGGLDPFSSTKLFPDLKIWSEINESLSKNSSQVNEDVQTAITNTNPRSVWWHTLCHKLILNLSADSGFSVVSLGERVYCKKDKDDGSYQSGILIYTAATGGDGTLGGLISLAEEKFMSKIFRKAAQGIISCSNDPVCSEIRINKKKITGACCHACQLLSETSCSYQNLFLDRNLVGGTLKDA